MERLARARARAVWGGCPFESALASSLAARQRVWLLYAVAAYNQRVLLHVQGLSVVSRPVIVTDASQQPPGWLQAHLRFG